ncbi:MAG TPA: hypothetical protein PK059_02990 [Cyclobacteriaceae bacterium]|nr:hypothetical protein [Cyclobacteriaceae bacterium]
MRLGTLILFILISLTSLAQKSDSAVIVNDRIVNAEDSVRKSIKLIADGWPAVMNNASGVVADKANRIRSGFQSRADSLHRLYQKPINKLDSVNRRLQSNMDSVRKLGRAGRKALAGYRHQFDSVSRAKTQKLREMNKNVEQLKSKTIAKLNQLDLPKELKGPVGQMEKSISRYSVPTVNGKIPSLATAGPRVPSLQIPGAQVPGLKLNTTNPSLNLPQNDLTKITQGATNELNKSTGQLNQLNTQVNGYTKDVKRISSGNLDSLTMVNKELERRAAQELNLKNLQGGQQQVTQYQTMLQKGNDPEAMKKMALAEAQKQAAMMPAVNHFAGQEQKLESAMGLMSNLKKKFSSLGSLEEALRKPPNEMKGKPLIERLVPAVTLQFMSGNTTMLVDVNPSVAYRFNGRLNIGLGWVDRLTIHDFDVSRKDLVYGVRSFGEFKIVRGLVGRADVETLNALIPVSMAGPTDSQKRLWGMSVLVGLKKEFKVWKKIQGNAQMLYRVWNEHDRTPYTDRLTVRMGFEFPMKKKQK